MKFFAVVCTFATLYGVSTGELCKSTNPSGTVCVAYADAPDWMKGHMGGETCFGGVRRNSNANHTHNNFVNSMLIGLAQINSNTLPYISII